MSTTDVQMTDANKQVIPSEKKTEDDPKESQEENKEEVEERFALYGAIKHGIDMLTLEDSDFTPRCILFLEIIEEWSLPQLRKLPDLLLSQFAKQVIVNTVIKSETGKSVYQEATEPAAEPKRKAPSDKKSKTTAKRSRTAKAKAHEEVEKEEVPLDRKGTPKKPAAKETAPEPKKSPAKSVQETPEKPASKAPSRANSRAASRDPTPRGTPMSQNSFIAKQKIKVLPEEFEKIRKDINNMCIYCGVKTKAHEGFVDYCSGCNRMLTERAVSKKLAKMRAEERAKESHRKNIEKILLAEVLTSKKSKQNRADLKRYQAALDQLRADEPINSGSEDDFEEGYADEIPTPSDDEFIDDNVDPDEEEAEEEEAEETDASDPE